jgi:histone deacetylase 1/2
MLDTSAGTLPEVPRLPVDDAMDDTNEDEDLIPPDERRPMRLLDSRRQADGELSDSDDEGEGGRRNHSRHKDRARSRSSGRESNSGSSGRKFGIGVGIMSSATTSMHGAGPSGHPTTARNLGIGGGGMMDVKDTPGSPPRSENSKDTTSAVGGLRENSNENVPGEDGDKMDSHEPWTGVENT